MRKILCLHGMFGKKEDWNFLKEAFQGVLEIYSLDLPGHGERELRETRESDLENLFNDINNVSPDFVLGYSLGGRILYYLQSSGLISSKSICIYESANLFNLNKREKEDRYKSDLARAQLLKEDPKAFFQNWYSLELWSFNDELKKIVLEDKFQYKNKTYKKWAETLIRYSPGHFEFPNTYLHQSFFIHGSLDQKYKKISNSLDKNHFSKIEISKAGHNTHLQNPKEFVSNLKKIFK